MTTIRTTGHPIEKIEFPAITVCAQVKFLVYVSAVAYLFSSLVLFFEFSLIVTPKREFRIV